MVQLEEVNDEDLEKPQEGPIEGDDDWDTDSDEASDSDVEDDVPEQESVFDRITALKDILPATQRRRLSQAVNTTTSWVTKGGLLAGKALWVVSTSALLLGVPWALAYTEEQQYAEMEREARMQEQGSQLLTSAGAADAITGGTTQARPAL